MRKRPSESSCPDQGMVSSAESDCHCDDQPGGWRLRFVCVRESSWLVVRFDMGDDAGKGHAVDDLALDGIGKLVRHPHGPGRRHDHMQADEGPLAGSTRSARVKVDSRRAVAVQDLLYSRFGLRSKRLVE